MPISAAAASQHLQSLNERKRRPFPAWMTTQMPSVYIYNTYPREHVVRLGSLGTWRIPACEPGKAYSDPLIVPGIFGDEFDLADGQGNMATNPLEGTKLAEDIVGIHGMVTKCDSMTSNLEWWGCFISKSAAAIAENNKHSKDTRTVAPSPDELAGAKQKLLQFATLLLHEGDELFADQNMRKYMTPVYREMASFLGQKRDWNATPEQRTECPGCGSNIRPNIAKCPNCAAILDVQKAAKLGLLPAGFEMPVEEPQPMRTPPVRK